MSLDEVPKVKVRDLPYEELCAITNWLYSVNPKGVQDSWWLTMSHIYFEDPELATIVKLKFKL